MKYFEYLSGSTYRVVSADHVKQTIDALSATATEQRANGERVLALAVGEEVTFASGNRFKRIEDDSPRAGTLAIVCGRRPTKRGRYCGAAGTRLCDFPVTKRGGKKGTCDLPMCARCARSAGANVDYCLPHFKLVRNGSAAR